MSDVVVAGGGPAGSVTALLLARRGFSVRLLEQRHFPRAKPCGEYMSPGVADTLERLGLVSALDTAPPRSVSGMRIIGPGGSVMDVRYQARGRMRSAMTLRRLDFDTALLHFAGASGVEVVEGARVQAPLVVNDAVAGVRGLYNGEPRVWEAPLTIAADGPRSILSRSLGLMRRPRWPVRFGLVAHYDEPAGRLFECGEMHVADGGYCGIAPLPGGQLNVAMVLRTDAVRDANATEVFEVWIRDHPTLRRALEGAARTSSVIGVGVIGSRARRPWFPGMLLVGDAAGFFDPFTGEGIFRALNGAELAARVGGDALKQGDMSARTLHVYEGLRAERFQTKQAVTSLVQLFVQYPALMRYALPRLSGRAAPYAALTGALGDIADPRQFLHPRVLWSALRP